MNNHVFFISPKVCNENLYYHFMNTLKCQDSSSTKRYAVAIVIMNETLIPNNQGSGLRYQVLVIRLQYSSDFS